MRMRRSSAVDSLIRARPSSSDEVPEDTPATLTLQLSLGRYDISREAMLADALRFGLPGHDAAASHLDALLLRIEHAYGQVEGMLSAGLQTLLRRRMRDNIDLLR